LKSDQLVLKRFEELIAKSQEVETTRWREDDYDYVNGEKFQEWATSAMSLLHKVYGPESLHYTNFREHHTKFKGLATEFELCRGTFKAAKEDYEGGYVFELRSLVRADLLDDFLSQAEMLLQEDYHVAAASLAGAVLEDTLRKLCDRKSIPYPEKTKIDVLNVSLAKQNVYDKLTQKEITAKADLRNNADHGHFDKVKSDDVADMIKWIRRFVQDHIR
jgi:hypothetical protein